MGNNFLKDIEKTIWDTTNDNDFVTLFPRMLEKDAFTSALNGVLLDIYHRVWGQRRKVCNQNPYTCKLILIEYHGQQTSSPFPGTGFREYDEAHMMMISNSVGAILSSLLPTIAILVLYFVKRVIVRIGLTIIFTSIFSLALSLFTEAKKVEIFSATAA